MKLLNTIQQTLKVPKNQYNSFGKYNYRNAEDIVEAVKPLLGEGTLVLTDMIVEVGGRNYIKATAKLSDGKEIESTDGWACEAAEKKGMDSAQITGAASSYARKYALNGLFAIDDTKDADSHENTPQSKLEPIKKPLEAPKSVVIEQKKAEIKKLCDAKALVPLFDKKDYGKYVLENTGLILEEGNLDAIIERLKVI